MIYDKATDQIRAGYNHLPCSACCYHRMNDFIVVSFLICLIWTTAHQFLYDIGKIRWHCLAYLRSCILRSCTAAQKNHTVDCHLIPFLDISFSCLDLIQLFSWIINQRCKFSFFFHAKCRSKHVINFPTDRS